MSGAPGLSAYQVAVLNGFRGSEADWLKSLVGRRGESIKGDQGERGPSAYEVALANGFRGTQAAWLDSLRGRDGIRGDKGERGEPGEMLVKQVPAPKPTRWDATVIRDPYRDQVAGMVIRSDLGAQWEVSVSRNDSDQIGEIVVQAI